MEAPRERFLASQAEEVVRAVEENESDMRKEFLGMKVTARQVCPWL